MTIAPTVQSVTAEIMELLASGQYDALVRKCATSRLSPGDLRGTIQSYGRRVVVPPQSAYRLLDAIQVRKASVPTWSVRMPLWTVEEGRSDLTIELTIAIADSKATVELDDLRVP